MHLAAAIPRVTLQVDPLHGATDEGLLPSDLRLRCPRCGAAIDGPACSACALAIDVRCGIVRALAPETHACLAGFIDDYERIRADEGRGGDDADYYLGLPYRDASGRDPWHWALRARSHDYVLRHLLPRRAGGSGGCVLDLGAGNCWMSHRLALAGYLPCAVDLLTNDHDGMGAARHYRTRLPALFPRFQASFAQLPFADAQFDAAVFNASFHYATDAVAVLGEALRCVKPGAPVILSDSPWYPREEFGQRMLAERAAAFLARHGTRGDAMPMLGFLTDARLQVLRDALRLEWEVHRPWYGLRWALRPLQAALARRRTPSRFRLFVARRAGAPRRTDQGQRR